MTELVTLNEINNSTGTGWIEFWLEFDDGDVECFELNECAWVRGGVIEHVGYAQVDIVSRDFLRRKYGKKHGVRVWRGDRPTDEQRKAAKWDDA